MLKLYFLYPDQTNFAHQRKDLIERLQAWMLKNKACELADSPDNADAVIIHEKSNYKSVSYIKALLASPISKYAGKLYTLNVEDGGTGLIKGLYTSIPRRKFNEKFHRSVPFATYPNEKVAEDRADTIPTKLAAWRGNPKSNPIRKFLLDKYKNNEDITVESTDSWMNHKYEEKQYYIDLIQQAKFSLCPGGWSPVTFRIYESMALRRCPVIIADNYVPPEGINWKDCAIFIPEKDVNNIKEILKERESEYKTLGETARSEWEQSCSPKGIYAYFSKELLTCISNAPPRSNEAEFKRWKSFSMRWLNRWTLSQRVLNKAKKLKNDYSSKLFR